jgi:hypothetical protein
MIYRLIFESIRVKELGALKLDIWHIHNKLRSLYYEKIAHFHAY